MGGSIFTVSKDWDMGLFGDHYSAYHSRLYRSSPHCLQEYFAIEAAAACTYLHRGRSDLSWRITGRGNLFGSFSWCGCGGAQNWSQSLRLLCPKMRIKPTVGFPGGSDGKESACNVGDLGLIPGLRKYPGGGLSNSLQNSCLENPHGQRSLVGYGPWHPKEPLTTEQLSTAQQRAD